MATRKKSKLSFNAKIALAIAILIAAAVILSGAPETAQYFKPTKFKEQIALIGATKYNTLSTKTHEMRIPSTISGPPVSGVTAIDKCQKITSPGNYTLTKDLSGVDFSCYSSGINGTNQGICLCIAVPNVVLNCNGFNLKGPGSGVAIGSFANNTFIKNCKADSYGSGIVAGGDKVVVVNNELTNMKDSGISAGGGNINVLGNKVSNGGSSTIGIEILQMQGIAPQNISIQSNIINACFEGITDSTSIYVASFDNVHITNNIVSNSFYGIIQEHDTKNTKIDKNFVCNNAYEDIRCGLSTQQVISGTANTADNITPLCEGTIAAVPCPPSEGGGGGGGCLKPPCQVTQ